MGKWLESIRAENSVFLEVGTDKTDKSPPEAANGSINVAEKFANLVRAFGVSHGILLDHSTILAELDADDLKCLESLDTHNKQVWAELLAFRLTQSRISAIHQ